SAPLFAAGVGNQCSGKFIFKMNIIGVPKGKNPPMNNSNRKTMFVALGNNGSATPKIWVTQAGSVACDGNGFDPAYDCNGNPITNSTNGGQTGAVFQLPCNLNVQADVACSGGVQACYDIYYRALGTPGGQATVTTCGLLSDGTK